MKKYWCLLLIFFCLSCVEQPENNTSNNLSEPRLFTKLTSDSTGISFVNKLPLDVRINVFTYEYFYNGGGVAIGDINNDGLDDIYFTSNLGDNKLYLNKEDFKFEDITASAGVQGKSGWATGVTMADVNADGLLDIYVCRSGRFEEVVRENELFINQGDLTFVESAAQYGLNDPGYSTQALFFDYDRDGDLDVYLLNHSIINFQGKYIQQWLNSSDPYAGDKLYRNDDGIYQDITSEAGINSSPLGYGLGVASGDLNQDGWPDLYVTNDYVEHDYMYINQKDGTFKEVIHEATNHISNFSMGVDIGDINNDGLQDIGVLDMVAEDNYRQKTNMASMNPQQFYQAVDYGFHHQYMFNTIQLNRGQTQFSDIAQLANVSNTDWSWSILFDDLNNDGWKDIFVTNGFRKEFGNKDFVKYRERKMQKAMHASREEKIQVIKTLLDSLNDGNLSNYVFENSGNLSFIKRNVDWGIDEFTYSNGAALADLDNDGDLDMVVNNIDQEAGIFRNNASLNDNTFIQFELQGNISNPSAIGSRVEIFTNEGRQSKYNFTTRGYQSSCPAYFHFGLGKNLKVDSVNIIWPDGSMQSVLNPEVNFKHKIVYKPKEQFEPAMEQTLFKEVAEAKGLTFVHKENAYDDYAKEVLLPHKMSQFGPAISVGDINNDGLDDIFIGGAKGFEGAVFTQTREGTFQEDKQQFLHDHKNYEDVGALFFDADGDGDLDLYVVSGGNEFESNDPMLKDRLYINDSGTFKYDDTRLPDLRFSGAAIAENDFDNDGDLDLFIGGRLVPGRYPFPASSALLQNDGHGKFKDITSSNAKDLFDIGMITDAVWHDMNDDGFDDLIVAGEWTAIVPLLNNRGNFVKSDEIGAVGWWYSLDMADLNNDGRRDLLAGNLGLNYKYKASKSEPFKVYADDFDGNGSNDIVLGYYNDGELFPLRGRQCSSEQIPAIKETFDSYHDFGLATLDQVYGKEKLSSALNYAATSFASSVFYNENGFEAVELPVMAQLSSINDFVVEDFNSDGIIDIIIAGNLYTSEIETTRNDASYGLLLLGKKSGGFDTVDLHESGLNIKGDIKRLEKIKLANNTTGILAAANNGRLMLFELSQN